MRRIKTLITVLLVLSLLTGGAIVWMAMRTGEQGDSAVERWIGEQIIGLVDSRLNPTLKFSDLDFQYPATVRVKDLSLSSADPRNGGKPIAVLAASEAVLTLAEIPKVGTPIRIEWITLSRPAVRLVP